MRRFRQKRGRTSIWLASLVLLSACCWSATAWGQSPGAASTYNPDSNKRFYNKNYFHLPIQIDDASRKLIQKVILYVKQGNRDWREAQVAKGTERYFSFRAPVDGEYWFSVVTVDTAGNVMPRNFRQEPPSLKVVVDTQPPGVDLAPLHLKQANNMMAIRCKILDANPEYRNVKMTYYGSDRTNQPLSPKSYAKELFGLPSGAVMNGTVRCTVTDKAGNTTTRTLNVGPPKQVAAADLTAKPGMPGMPPLPPKVPPTGSQTKSNQPKVARTNYNQPSVSQPQYTPPSQYKPANPPLSTPPQYQNPNTPPQYTPPAQPNPNPQYAQRANPGPSYQQGGVTPPTAYKAPEQPEVRQAVGREQSYPPTMPSIRPAQGEMVPLPHLRPVNNVYVQTPPQSPQAADHNTNPMVNSGQTTRQIINTRLATIEYRIDRVGPSGLSRVDVWVKGEQGIWQKLGSDVDQRSPAKVMLPSEGMYGIRVVATNGHDVGGQPPRPNDPPSFWIEVDQTPPEARLNPVNSVTGGRMVELRWFVSDKNLGQSPISLYYATRPEGPWLPIVRGQRNTGSHSWSFPRNAGSQFYVRLEATDLAGNRTMAELPAPITLDMTVPSVSVIGVSGSVNGQ